MEQPKESGHLKKKPKPNFLIVGAAKAGTTSLAKYLNEHPDIFIPEAKELRFFVKDSLSQMSDEDPLKEHIFKTSVFDEVEYFKTYEVPHRFSGDASVHYLNHSEEAIPKIKEYLGDVQIIIMLRNPVDRLVSHYKYLKSHYNNSLEKEIELEKDRKERNFNSFWFIKELGFYSKNVENYFNNFSKVKIILFEDFISNQDEVFKDCLQWLGAADYNLKNKQIFNPSVRTTSFGKLLYQFKVMKILKRIMPVPFFNYLKAKFLFLFKRKLDFHFNGKQRYEIAKIYKEDISRLNSELNLDLTAWSEDYDL